MNDTNLTMDGNESRSLLQPFVEVVNRGFSELHVDVHVDAFELSVWLFALLLLLCPIFRLGMWISEQHMKAQRRIAHAEHIARLSHEPEDDHDDHEREAHEPGALPGSNLREERKALEEEGEYRV